MLENSSLSNNSFNGDHNLNSTTYDYLCIFHSPGSSIYSTFIALDAVILLPVCLLVFYYAHREQRCLSSATTSHSDCFTYHMATMDLVVVLRDAVACYSIHTGNIKVINASTTVSSFTWWGQLSLHMLQCIERYLAVVHPITYLSLRAEGGIRIRNIAIGCVWCFSFLGLGLSWIPYTFIKIDLVLLLLSVTVVSFCSVSVLYVLIQPGPGKPGRDKRQGDRTKRKAFYTILFILAVLGIKLAWLLVWVIYYFSAVGNACAILLLESLLSIPSSVVLPLLYLHRTGKLTCCSSKPK